MGLDTSKALSLKSLQNLQALFLFPVLCYSQFCGAMSPSPLSISVIQKMFILLLLSTTVLEGERGGPEWHASDPQQMKLSSFPESEKDLT